jgi:hypothetical protein
MTYGIIFWGNTNQHQVWHFIKSGGILFWFEVFNYLPPNIENPSNEVKLFIPALKRFLLSSSFYSLDEYFNCNFN